MSHQITENMMAYKAEKPWHGLGIEVAEDATGQEMLVAAGMDWKVQRRALAMRDGNGGNLLTEPLANYRAIVRADTDQVFQVATSRYHPLQNQQIVEFFREYCEVGNARMETLGAINGGAKIWALAKLSETAVGGVDTVGGYLLLATSHDGSLRTVGKATTVRVVCYNTLAASIYDERGRPQGEFLMKHSRKWTPQVAKEARRKMGMAREGIQELTETAEMLSRVKIDDRGRVQFVRELLGIDEGKEPEGVTLLDRIAASQSTEPEQEFGRLGKALIDAITDSPGSDLPTAKDTLWGAVNGVSYHVDHERGRNQHTRLSGAWFGDGDRLKRSALQTAIQMSGY